MSASTAALQTEVNDSCNIYSDASLAFPSAEGFGKHTLGGRGGRVTFVTNTDNAGVGSLRDALESDGPRIVIFRVGGLIQLDSAIKITNPYITVAGQTAPGGGIALANAGIEVKTHDVIIRGIRFRIGDNPNGPPGVDRDGIKISSGNNGGPIYNVIVDHSSVSWGIDENISTWAKTVSGSTETFRQLDHVTIQWSIVAEGLYNSIHIDEGDTQPGPHSMGLLIGEGTESISVHHNLFAHNNDRNPNFKGALGGEFINNVVYNWGDGPTVTGSYPNSLHIFANYYRSGTDSRHDIFRFSDTPASNTKYYLLGNIRDDPNNDEYDSNWTFINGDQNPSVNMMVFEPSGVAQSEAASAYDEVLAYAGAIHPYRDAVDIRVIDDVQQLTGQIIDSQSDVGGWPSYPSGNAPTDNDQDGMPDVWEEAIGLDPNTNDADTDRNGDGIANIEEYINCIYPNG
ncbi:MAG: hypothetical protein IPJ88_06420 [Myxococcales bacterium]|nr:MAG: hypothetical protein IPJ88_06420 [Myxococcales bacterium]